MKKIVKALTPPVLLTVLKKVFNTGYLNWTGNYDSWDDALKKSTGYDNELILEKCKTALLKVKSGEKAYERDSVLFDEIQYSWGLLAGLQLAAKRHDNKLCVLDFGGSLGSSYFQNKDFLGLSTNTIWCIVEQKHFVDCGKEYFADNHLKFYYTIESCLEENEPNVLLLSSVLQYLEEPYVWLSKFLETKAPIVIIDRTGFWEGRKDRITIQHVPQTIYKASYPCWFFNENKLIEFFNNHGYDSMGSWDSPFESNIGKLKGFIFSKRK